MFDIQDDVGEGKSLPRERVILDDDGTILIEGDVEREIVQSILDKLRTHMGSNPTDEELFEALNGWTNGYLKIREISA